MTRRPKLDQLYDLRARIDEQIADEVARLEREAERERKRLDSMKRSGWAACGTDGGYYRHVRTLKEHACSDCKKAHSKAESDRNARRRAAA